LPINIPLITFLAASLEYINTIELQTNEDLANKAGSVPNNGSVTSPINAA